MWIIQLGLGTVDILYFILICIILAISLVATIYNETLIPILWGGTVGFILILFQPAIEPILLGFFIHGCTIIGVVFLILLISWLSLIVQGLYNCLVHDGRPWA